MWRFGFSKLGRSWMLKRVPALSTPKGSALKRSEPEKPNWLCFENSPLFLPRETSSVVIELFMETTLNEIFTVSFCQFSLNPGPPMWRRQPDAVALWNEMNLTNTIRNAYMKLC